MRRNKKWIILSTLCLAGFLSALLLYFHISERQQTINKEEPFSIGSTAQVQTKDIVTEQRGTDNAGSLHSGSTKGKDTSTEKNGEMIQREKSPTVGKSMQQSGTEKEDMNRAKPHEGNTMQDDTTQEETSQDKTSSQADSGSNNTDEATSATEDTIRTSPVQDGRTGNGNYFNTEDGRYYADKEFTTPANDNTLYLKNLCDGGGDIYIPEGNYVCKKQIRLKGKSITIHGVEGKTRIAFEGSDYKNDSGDFTVNAVIVNDHFSRRYDDNLAQSIEITGIAFEYQRRDESSPISILGLANVNGVKISDCSLVSSLGRGVYVTLIDLFSCCKNVNISNCTFVNLTNASKGSCIWVRNYTEPKKRKGNLTENVTIEGCTFTQNAADEIIAAYSSIGHTRNIVIKGCVLNDLTREDDKVLSIFSSDNKDFGTVSNVLVDHNVFNSDYTKTFTITVGGPGRKNKVSSITISNNTINIGESNLVAGSKIIYVNDIGTDISNVQVLSNTLNVQSSQNTTAIYNADYVKENTIIGNMKFGIVFGKAYQNIIKGPDVGIDSPDIAGGNKISGCKIGISCDIKECLIKDNEIILDRTDALGGIQTKEKESAGEAQITCTQNTIVTTVESQYSFIIHNGNLKLSLNKTSGPGGKVYQNKNAVIQQY